MISNLHVLVAGATGNQGGAVARALLRRGHRVRAVVRDPNSASARALVELGADLAQATYNDRASLTEAARGVDSAFMVTAPAAGVENEVEQGYAQADALADASVSHVVFSSVGSAHRQTGIPHFDSKFRTEQRLNSRGIPHTVSGPTYFMENLLFPDTVSGIAAGTPGTAMPGDRKLQMQAVSDIGEFSASLLERRDDVIGRRIDIAADELSGHKIAAVLSGVTGVPVSYQALSPDMFRPAMEDMALMFEWFDRVSYEANIESLRIEFSDVPWLRFEAWAKTQKWAQ